MALLFVIINYLKVQGMEPKQTYVLMNKNFFASGQAYVALSRVKRLEDLFLLEFDPGVIYLADRQRELLKWMETVDLCADTSSTGASCIPMPKLPEQTFLNKMAPKQNCTKMTKPSEVKRVKERGDMVYSSKVHSLVPQLLTNPVHFTCQNGKAQLTNARRVLKNATNQPDMYSLLDTLRMVEPAEFSEETHTLPRDMDERLHPVLSHWYRPTETPPDGNCLWHMISLCLCGSTDLMPILRLVTAFTLVENEQYFQQLIGYNEHASLSFQEQVAVALNLSAWGGEMHLHALSIALHRPIYIYTTFLKPDQHNMYLSDAHSVELQDHFRNRVRGTTQHLVYLPPGAQAEILGRSPLCGMFLAQHYTALLPESTEPVRFVPISNVTNGGNRYLLSAYFRRPALNIQLNVVAHEE